MIRKTIKGGDFKSQMVGELVFDQVPEEGSFNPVTSDAVAKIAGGVADLDAIVPEGASEENKLATAADVAGIQEDVDTIEGKIPSDTSTTNKLVNESGLQDAIDNASESWSTGFTPKGESSVSDLNDLDTQSNGDSYIVTDSGTLTDGSLAVVAGDQVAWDATNGVWYKLPQYALASSVEKEIDASVFDIGSGVVLDMSSYLLTVVEGYVGGPTGDLVENSSYRSYIYDVESNTTLYEGSGYSGEYLSVSVTNKAMTSGTRYRKMSGEDTLPTENNPVNVEAGKRLIISVQRSNNGGWSFVLPSERCRKSFNQNIPLAEKHVEQVLEQVSSIVVQYHAIASVEDSTEYIDVFVPSKVGFVHYLFTHNVSAERNCDVWRISVSNAVDSSKTQRFALTTAGEWECAIMLKDRDDFAGGYAHGDEALVSNPYFFIDGRQYSKTDMAKGVVCKEFRVVTKTYLFDPDDHETIFALHGCEHVFSSNGVCIRQSVGWRGAYDVTSAYLAMNLPSKAISTHYYVDSAIGVAETPNPLSSIYIYNVRRMTLFAPESGVFNEFYLGDDYPYATEYGTTMLFSDNSGSAYNKGYFLVKLPGVPIVTSSDLLWKSEHFVNFVVSK